MRARNFWRPEKLELDTGGIGERELDFGAVEARDFAAVELAQQVVFGRRNEIDQFAVESFFFGEGFGVGDGGFRERGIAAALVGEAAKKSHGVVVDFLAHGFVDGHGVAANNETGEAAPVCVPGAIAAMSAESRM